jgi:hypothetical protein
MKRTQVCSRFRLHPFAFILLLLLRVGRWRTWRWRRWHHLAAFALNLAPDRFKRCSECFLGRIAIIARLFLHLLIDRARTELECDRYFAAVRALFHH